MIVNNTGESDMNWINRKELKVSAHVHVPWMQEGGRGHLPLKHIQGVGWQGGSWQAEGVVAGHPQGSPQGQGGAPEEQSRTRPPFPTRLAVAVAVAIVGWSVQHHGWGLGHGLAVGHAGQWGGGNHICEGAVYENSLNKPGQSWPKLGFSWGQSSWSRLFLEILYKILIHLFIY